MVVTWEVCKTQKPKSWILPRKLTNVFAENRWLEDEISCENCPFSGDMLIFRGVRLKKVPQTSSVNQTPNTLKIRCLFIPRPKKNRKFVKNVLEENSLLGLQGLQDTTPEVQECSQKFPATRNGNLT